MELPLEIELAMTEAEDALNEAGVPFLLFVGHEGFTTSASGGMLSGNRDMLRRWVDNGHWNQLLLEHLESLDRNEACP